MRLQPLLENVSRSGTYPA